MVLHTPIRATVVQLPVVTPRTGPSAGAAVGGLAGGGVPPFIVSWLGTDVLQLHHDVFYPVYLTCELGYLAYFAARAGPAWQEVLRRHVWWSLTIGIVVGVAVSSARSWA